MPGTSHMMQEASTYWRKKYGPISWGTEGTFEITENTSFDSTQDGDMVIKRYDGLSISEGTILTTSNRCKGLIIFIDGDLIVNGKISMTARGANVSGENLAINLRTGNILINPSNPENYEYTISSTGGLGAGRRFVRSGSANGYTGSTGVNGACGGGGSGAANGDNEDVYSGAGAAGTSYSGGSGGGGCSSNPYGQVGPQYADNGNSNGGTGGHAQAIRHDGGAAPRCAGGGAGNPGGSGASDGCTGHSGSSGTGGLLILVVSGNVYIGTNGIIESNGSSGGYAYRAGGGGSGGGSVNVLYKGLIDNRGTIQANGGSGGGGNATGGAGGAGTVRVEQFTI